MHGIAATADRGVEPAVHVEEQVLEAALGHQNLDPHRERMVVDPLLRRAPPVHATSRDAVMFMICSDSRPLRKRFAGLGKVGVSVEPQRYPQAWAWSRITA